MTSHQCSDTPATVPLSLPLQEVPNGLQALQMDVLNLHGDMQHLQVSVLCLNEQGFGNAFHDFFPTEVMLPRWTD